ncbi:hypothetical protein IC575_029090 [Cucumis melo]|uniref:Uncharacterized protein LOC103487421 n=1 Tax=Cucumis melo TaxID=3656 RepID=A0A1S3BA32_CUCME|nr:uncharacterized protein LOC103487421 [Cucumis melo]XP_008443965.2 uncharacterized protein LOC103487421 [Cucumis melo]
MDVHHSPHRNSVEKPEAHKPFNKDATPGYDLWTDGLICAFEYIGRPKKATDSKSKSKMSDRRQMNSEFPTTPELNNGNVNTHERKRSFEPTSLEDVRTQCGQFCEREKVESNSWLPIGWDRISELVQTIQVEAEWASMSYDFMDEEDDLTVADLVAPYWKRPAGPIWWCHVSASHPSVEAWLRTAHWLHPAISLALRDESRLISDRMKHLFYEVPVRVAGGLLFELLGQSAGDPFSDEDDIPVVLRSWQAQNFLITSLHVKGPISNINILGITEVQELLIIGGYNAPRTVHEVIAHLACRLTRWDDRLFRKSIFGAADEIELKFMDRRNHEDMHLFSIILNQEIRKLSRQVIRVKWSLHAREEIVYELLQHLRGYVTKGLLESIRKSTRQMIEEQEAVRDRLFTIQDVMQSNVRAWLQDKSLRVTHNLAVFGGCGLVLSIITGLFGINVDGIPGAQNTPYAFGMFTAILFFLGIALMAGGLVYLGLKKPMPDQMVEVRKLELEELVKMFQHEAETHAQMASPINGKDGAQLVDGGRLSNNCNILTIRDAQG